MINSSYWTLRMPSELSWIREVLMVALASICIALCAPVAISLPFTPIPLTVQGSLILFFAALLGPQRAVAAVSLFLLQGALGLPVFARGMSGFLVLLGPTGGYLMGYLVAAFVTGWIAERARRKTALSLFFAMGAGNLVVLSLGTAWLSQFTGAPAALMLGFVPFIVGDFLKLVIASRVPMRFFRKSV